VNLLNHFSYPLSPRANLANLQGKIPQEQHEECARANAAHYNGLEQFPYFAVTMVSLSLWPRFRPSLLVHERLCEALYYVTQP
jgi:uncharacterized MAPEG superfamily protein